MPKVNKYSEIKDASNEQRASFIDKHSPFISVEGEAKLGEPILVKVKVGDKVAHPDVPDHYVSDVQLYNGETKLAEAHFKAGILGESGQQEVIFKVVLDKDATLVAHCYCTLHGIWESDPVEVKVK